MNILATLLRSPKALGYAVLVVFTLWIGVSAVQSIKSYNEALVRSERLSQEIEMLVETNKQLGHEIESLNKEKESLANLWKEREKDLKGIQVDSEKRKQVINENANEECVNTSVPEPVFNSLLNYARERNSGASEEGKDISP
jgi:cell division protein FtsB